MDPAVFAKNLCRDVSFPIFARFIGILRASSPIVDSEITVIRRGISNFCLFDAICFEFKSVQIQNSARTAAHGVHPLHVTWDGPK